MQNGSKYIKPSNLLPQSSPAHPCYFAFQTACSQLSGPIGGQTAPAPRPQLPNYLLIGVHYYPAF